MSQDEPVKVVKERGQEDAPKKKFSQMDLAMIAKVNVKEDGEPILTEEQIQQLAEGTYDTRTFYWGTKLAKIGFRAKKSEDTKISKYLRDPVKSRGEVMQMIFEATEKYVTPDIHATMRYLNLLTKVLAMKGMEITDEDFKAARDKLAEEATQRAEQMVKEAQDRAAAEALEAPSAGEPVITE